MRCTQEHIHDIEIQIQNGDNSAAVELCRCFMPEIKASTRFAGRMQSDAIQEVCSVLVSKAIEHNSDQIQH